MPVINMIRSLAITNVLNTLLISLIVVRIMEDKFNGKK